MKIEFLKDNGEYWPDVEKMISDKLIKHIVDRLEELGETEVLSNPLWISRERSDKTDAPTNIEAYNHAEDYPNGLSRYICEESDYKGEITDFLLIRKKVGSPLWFYSYMHLLEEEDYKYIFDQLKKIGEQNEHT